MKKLFFIGIDFSKEWFDATILMVSDLGELVIDQQRFDNNTQGYNKFLKWVKKKCAEHDSKAHADRLFCGEHTGFPSLGLSIFLVNREEDMWLHSALDIKQSMGIQRTKTDQSDSLLIAQFASRHYHGKKFRLFIAPSEDTLKLEAKLKSYEVLTKERVALNNRLKSGAFDADPATKEMQEKRLIDLTNDRKNAYKDLEQFVSTCPEFAETYRLMKSIKGVGVIITAVVIVETGNLQYLTDPREFATQAGCAPFREESGKTKKKPTVSKYRKKSINALLSCCIAIAIKSNPVLKKYAERLKEKGKPEHTIRTNCKNKLIHLIFGVLNSGIPFDPELHGLKKEDRDALYAQKVQKRQAEDQAKAEAKAAHDKARAEKKAITDAKKAAKERMEEIVLELSSSTPPDGMKKWTLTALAEAASKFSECKDITAAKVGRILRKLGSSTIERKRK